MQARLPPVSAYEGVVLGVEPKLGIQEAGFYPTQSYRGRPARWTNGNAALKLRLDPANPPRAFRIETAVPGRDGVRLRVLANRVELWDERVPSEPWSRTFELNDVPLNDELLIELQSETLKRGRRLGVMVRAIEVTTRRPE